MVKKPQAGKAGKYGTTRTKEGLAAAAGKGAAKKGGNKKFTKKKVPQSNKKALVSKEVLEALKENRKEKQHQREEKLKDMKNNPKKKRKASEPEKTTEPLKKKQLKNVRKSNEDTEYENLVKIKKLWEKGRVNELDAKKRTEIVAEMETLMEGKVESLMFKHDLARVVQLLLRLSKAKEDNFVIKELLPHVKELSKSKYGKFTVNCMLKNSTPAQRNEIFKSFSGSFKKLTLHAEAVTVIDTIYNDYATSNQRNTMITEFYGKELGLYKDMLSEHFAKVIEQFPEKKEKVLEELLQHTQVFIEKGLTGHIIVQHIMLQFFLHGSEDNIQELVTDKLIAQIVNFVHTKEGSRIAMRALWYSKAKERKLIIKTFKGHVKEMCLNEHSCFVLCALFDCVDDTVLVKKSIISEVLENLDTISMSQSGRTVINYLLSPRNTKLFPPSLIDILKVGDSNATSKKDGAVRRKELLTHAASGVVECFKGSVEGMLLENTRTLLLANAIRYVNCDVTPLLDEVVGILDTDDAQIESATTHLLLRNIQQDEKIRDQFNEALLNRISTGEVINWVASNRGAFTVLRIIEQKDRDYSKNLILKLKERDLNSFTQNTGRDKIIEFLKAN